MFLVKYCVVLCYFCEGDISFVNYPSRTLYGVILVFIFVYYFYSLNSAIVLLKNYKRNNQILENISSTIDLLFEFLLFLFYRNDKGEIKFNFNFLRTC